MNLNQLENTPPWEWPDSAGKTIRAAISDRKSPIEQRRVALHLASEQVVGSDTMVNALMAIVSDATEPDEIRGAAAIALGPSLEAVDLDEFDDPEIQPISEEVFDTTRARLHALFDDVTVPMEVRRNILEAAVRAPDDWQTEAVRAAFVSQDPRWRLTAVFCMRFVPGFEAQILEALRAQDVAVRSQAVQAAGVWSIDAAWETVVAIAASESAPKELRIDAIEAIGAIRPREAGPVLTPLLDSDDEDIVSAVEEASAMAEAMAGFDPDAN